MKKFLAGIMLTILIGALVAIAAGAAPPPPGEPPGEPPAPAPKIFSLSRGHPYGFSGEIYRIEGEIIWFLPQGLKKEDVEHFGEGAFLKIAVGEKTELFKINRQGRKELISLDYLKTDQKITMVAIWKWNGKEAQRIQIMEKP